MVRYSQRIQTGKSPDVVFVGLGHNEKILRESIKHERILTERIKRSKYRQVIAIGKRQVVP